MIIEVLDTKTLWQCADEADRLKLNRRVTDEFRRQLDPKGTHLVAFRFPHNDSEWRMQLFCKMQGTDEPAEVWLDVPIEFAAFGKMEIPDPQPSVT